MKETRMVYVFAAALLLSCAHKPPAEQKPVVTETKVAAPEKRIPGSEAEESPWTTWSSKGTVGGLKVLKHIREELLAKNLHDPHVSYTGYKPIDCSKTTYQFRSADGTCNNMSNAHVGAAGVAFGRNVPPEYIDKDAGKNLMSPNPTLVSKELFTRDEFKPVPFLNMLAACWIQFMNHDWLTHGPNMKEKPIKVPGVNGPSALVDRTHENPQVASQYKSEFGRVNLNQVTHWWDGSQIYGSNQEEQSALREFSRGRLKVVGSGDQELLPKRTSGYDPADNRQNQGYEETGFKDNWWVGLSLLHTLFVKEHNAIAAMLFKNHVTYDTPKKQWRWKNGKQDMVLDERQLDEQVFQTARLINAAVMAKIHTVEWTPAILANKVLKRAMFTNWYGGINPEAWGKIARHFSFVNKTDWFPGIKSGYIIGGIVGDRTNDFGVPFSITEEFTSVYRLHSLLPENIELKTLEAPQTVESIPFEQTRNDKSYGIMETHSLRDLFYSFGTQHPGQLVLNNFPKFMQDLTVPGHRNLDMAMVDVLRDRERGVPRYNQIRRALNLKPINSYRDFFKVEAGKGLDERQQRTLQKFYTVYGTTPDGKDNIEAIDLLVGTSAEEIRPKNYGFGETMFQIFILMASRRLMADRFYTTDFRKEIYTKSGLDWIDDEGTFGQVIVRHMPELAPKVAKLDTAFAPWNP